MSIIRRNLSILKMEPAFPVALTITVLYYSILLQPGMRETALAHYTTEHAVEYVIVTLFFWGMIDIVMKLMSIPREIVASRHEWLPARAGREPVTNAAGLLNRLRDKPNWLQSSRIGRRLIEVLSFVTEKGSTDEYSEHLRHLADVDEMELHSKYTVLRFIIAVTPILGFLGTVVHFGGAIGSFSFEDMDAKLPAIVGGMGTAFNTTSVALATAMTMMFAMFLCERVDQSILASIDRLVDRELLNRFENQHAEITPFVSVIQAANQEALRAITQTMALHTEAWTRGLDTLFEHFRARQQQELTRQQEAFEQAQQRQQAWEVTREQQYHQMLEHFEDRQQGQSQQLQAVLERAVEFREDIGELLRSLNAIAQGEGRLTELQHTLNDNLRVLHESSELDTAMQGLTAAIHLMTTKNRKNGLSDSAAA